MLILGLKEGDSIEVTGPCRIELVRERRSHCGNYTRVGFDAPPSTKVLRSSLDGAEEIMLERIRQEQMERAAAE